MKLFIARSEGDACRENVFHIDVEAGGIKERKMNNSGHEWLEINFKPIDKYL